MIDQRKLRILMLQKGIDNQTELAECLGIKSWTLTKAIRGYHPYKELRKKIEEFFGVKPGSLHKAA